MLRGSTGKAQGPRVMASDVKFHEIFWRETFHEIFREIFLKNVKNFAMFFSGRTK